MFFKKQFLRFSNSLKSVLRRYVKPLLLQFIHNLVNIVVLSNSLHEHNVNTDLPSMYLKRLILHAAMRRRVYGRAAPNPYPRELFYDSRWLYEVLMKLLSTKFP